jgi:hypothetical protein
MGAKIIMGSSIQYKKAKPSYSTVANFKKANQTKKRNRIFEPKNRTKQMGTLSILAAGVTTGEIVALQSDNMPLGLICNALVTIASLFIREYFANKRRKK